MSIPKQVLISLAVVIVAIGAWYAFDQRANWFGSAATTPSREAGAGSAGAGPARGSLRARGGVPVRTALVGVDMDGPEIRSIGTLAAARAVTLYPEVTGTVTAVEIQPGAEVEERQVLVKLNDEDQVIAIDRAMIALDDAKAALDRAERLAASSNFSEVALANVRTEMRSAEIDVRSAELERSKRIVRAPFSGVVGLIPVSVGDLVSTSTPLTTLDDVSSLTVTFDAPERLAGRLHLGHPVTGGAIGLPGRVIRGEVSAIDSRVDPNTRVFKAEAELEQGIEDLKPGMSITVAADLDGLPQVTVPSTAIQWDRQGSYVWTLDGNTAERTGVDIVGRRSGSVLVAGDIEPDTEVIVEGLQRMREGVLVDRVDGTPAAAPGTPEQPETSEGAGDALPEPTSDRAG